MEGYGDSESESEDDDMDSVSVIADRTRDRLSGTGSTHSNDSVIIPHPFRVIIILFPVRASPRTDPRTRTTPERG